ncbi:MAG: PTS sugar transporter subunit IIA [Collinsella sp.]|nr:PTS sugar transporter subunit IIA [Collinsella sp.]
MPSGNQLNACSSPAALNRAISKLWSTASRSWPYIVLSKSVALAHARPECGVKKGGITFTTLKRGVPFGSEQFDPIGLIITLAAVDDNAHLDLMMELAGVLMDESNIEALVYSKTPEEFRGNLLAAL